MKLHPTPPPTISPELREVDQTAPLPVIDAETRHELRRVRQELWMGSLKGLVGGIFLGVALHNLATRIPQLKKKFKTNRNTMVFTAITCGACCSYLGSVVQGKNAFAFSNIIELLRRDMSGVTTANGSDPTGLTTLSYQAQLRQNENHVLNNLDQSFHRRAEAIKKAKESRETEINSLNLKDHALFSPYPTDNDDSIRR